MGLGNDVQARGLRPVETTRLSTSGMDSKGWSAHYCEIGGADACINAI